MKVFARGRAIAEDSIAVNRDAGIRRQFRVPGLRSTVLSILAASLLLLPSQAHAQGPGLGNLTYGPNEMFKAISVINSPNGHGKVAMVNGYLMVIYSSDGGGNSGNGGIEFWDVSDPRNPSWSPAPAPQTPTPTASLAPVPPTPSRNPTSSPTQTSVLIVAQAATAATIVPPTSTPESAPGTGCTRKVGQATGVDVGLLLVGLILPGLGIVRIRGRPGV